MSFVCHASSSSSFFVVQIRLLSNVEKEFGDPPHFVDATRQCLCIHCVGIVDIQVD